MTDSRRRFLQVASAAAVSACARRTPTENANTPQPVKLPTSPLTALSAHEAVALMRRGDLAAERYATALLERCAARTDLNAFISLEPARVLESARAADRRRASNAPLGALHGLPIPIKDSFNTRDYPTTAGTPALRHFRPRDNAPLVQTLVDAGAIVLGKTNLHELSYGWTSNNLAFGAVRNPYDLGRIPGGSSGGTAAAIAAHLAPLGVAEDTQGSIRVPAAFCGLVGFRPTTGRYVTVGAVPISALFDQAGPQARSVTDIALFDDVVGGDHQALAPMSLTGVKLGICRSFWFEGLEPEVERLTEVALKRLQDAGAILVEDEIPGLAALIDATTYQVQNHDVRIELPRYLETYGAEVGFADLVAQASADIRQIFAHDVLEGGPGFVSESVYRSAVDVQLPRLRKLYREFFARTGAAAIVFPTTRITAPLIGDEVLLNVGAARVPFDEAVARNISPGSTAGVPGLVIPLGLATNGLPVSLELDAPAGADRQLLSLGLAVERCLGSIPAPA
jgi:Asp-tRNA(Asn)/Glu-tRNA(Gln) amidotransferase A subunit family amidase